MNTLSSLLNFIGQRISTVYSRSVDGTGTIPNGISGDTYTSITSTTLDPGVYDINMMVYFAQNATGLREIGIGTSASGPPSAWIATDYRQALNGGVTICRCHRLQVVSEPTTFYFLARQNSGSSLTITLRSQITKLGDTLGNL